MGTTTSMLTDGQRKAQEAANRIRALRAMASDDVCPLEFYLRREGVQAALNFRSAIVKRGLSLRQVMGVRL